MCNPVTVIREGINIKVHSNNGRFQRNHWARLNSDISHKIENRPCRKPVYLTFRGANFYFLGPIYPIHQIKGFFRVDLNGWE